MTKPYKNLTLQQKDIQYSVMAHELTSTLLQENTKLIARECKNIACDQNAKVLHTYYGGMQKKNISPLSPRAFLILACLMIEKKKKRKENQLVHYCYQQV